MVRPGQAGGYAASSAAGSGSDLIPVDHHPERAGVVGSTLMETRTNRGLRGLPLGRLGIGSHAGIPTLECRPQLLVQDLRTYRTPEGVPCVVEK
jgi:hypothetical protein